MRLEKFRVTNFRSVNDSGEINVSDLTALLGRNESGKSNLLRALESLNPADGFEALKPIKDFPRHRRLEECSDDTPVLWTRWSLTAHEQAELRAILPRAVGIQHVTVSRRYDKNRLIGFEGLAAQELDEADIRGKIRKVVPAVKASADKLPEPAKGQLATAADKFEGSMGLVPDRIKWAQGSVAALAELRKALAAADADLSEKQEQIVVELEELASAIANDKDAQAKARTWVVQNLPTFIYVDEYPDLLGHQNVAEYVARKTQNQQLTASDHSFEKLCKVAGLEPAHLQDLFAKNEHETRNQLANRAGSVVTGEIRRLWKDRPLKVRFNLDAHHLDTLVSDPNAMYDVEVNLSERSRGFQWFFSFYITFSADTRGGIAEKAILLLDEPGLYLHARSQTDLLAHFDKDFKNQIVYTTHSPFMVPTHKLDSVRTVSIDETAGTTVTNNPTGDSRTLFPLQAALGYNIAQTLFIGSNNFVVEGVTDFWILSSVSSHFGATGRSALDDSLTITPAGGAQKVNYMVALLTAEEQKVLVLLDDEKEARATGAELIKNKLIAEQNVLFVTEAFDGGGAGPREGDVEDLLDPGVYEALVREAYATELSGKTLSLNPNIPRIVKRMESAFEAVGLKFNKTRAARLFLKIMAADPAAVLPASSADLFERLFQLANERLTKLIARRAPAFN